VYSFGDDDALAEADALDAVLLRVASELAVELAVAVAVLLELEDVDSVISWTISGVSFPAYVEVRTGRIRNTAEVRTNSSVS
jgi:hypothetical protein